jgi:ATP-dependent Lon protease
MDRMEIIRIAGYTEDEKLEIARRHLLPKAIRDTASRKASSTITDEALRRSSARYTREAGVRNLEREMMKLARKASRTLRSSRRRKRSGHGREPRRLSSACRASAMAKPRR